MGSIYREPAGHPVQFFDDGMHLAAQIWKRLPEDCDEFFEWLAPTDRPLRARPKEVNVVRQNLVCDSESSQAH